MTTNIHRESAKIYTFPTRTRSQADAYIGQSNAVVKLRFSRANVAVDAWYHQAAVQEAENEPKN